MLPPPFRAERTDIAAPRAGSGFHLTPIDAAEAPVLAASYAGIDPWLRYRVPAERLAGLFAPADDGAIRRALRTADGTPVGIAVVRQPWLIGPYMQFLAVHPSCQGRGLGRAMLDWFEGEARRAGARNLWICVATFNSEALRLYRSFGFAEAALLDGLIADGFDERLLRKRLA